MMPEKPTPRLPPNGNKFRREIKATASDRDSQQYTSDGPILVEEGSRNCNEIGENLSNIQEELSSLFAGAVRINRVQEEDASFQTSETRIFP
jgi:hypothetical protein